MTNPKLQNNGRKYRMTLIAMLIILAGYGLTVLNPVLQTSYAELAGGIVGLVLVYCGGNVSNKFVLTRPGREPPPDVPNN